MRSTSCEPVLVASFGTLEGPALIAPTISPEMFSGSLDSTEAMNMIL